MIKSKLKKRVSEIIEIGEDHERAHAEEDSLHIEIIKEFCPKWVIAEIDRLSVADFHKYKWCA